jgi:hypothetical protein
LVRSSKEIISTPPPPHLSRTNPCPLSFNKGVKCKVFEGTVLGHSNIQYSVRFERWTMIYQHLWANLTCLGRLTW